MNEKGRTPRKSLDDTLREALHAAPDGFDYEALVAGTHERAGRIRRRRAVGTLAAAAVLVPGLVGGGVLVNSMIEDQAVQPLPAGPSEGGSDQATEGDSGTSDEAVTTDDRAATTQQPTTPPWQDGELPEAPAAEGDTASDNAWEIPDPRPTGVEFLDQFGEPQQYLEGPNLAPAMGAMACNLDDREDWTRPVAGANWGFFLEEGDNASLDLVVTGWDDGAGAMEGVRADELFCAWDAGDDGESVQAEIDWPGHEGDEDRYLNETYPAYGYMSDYSVSVAVVRAGDYLVAVRAQDLDPEVAQDASTEIAEKAAENLAALDPEHGRDR